MRIHVHQRVPATRFNNIFLKLFDRYATYCYIQVSLRSKRFRAVQEQRKRNESQRPRENDVSKRAFFGSCFISRAAKTENPVPRSFFAPKPNGNACYAGYIQVDLKSFLASGAFFFRSRSERASYDFASNKFQTFWLFDCKSRNQNHLVARLGHLDNIFCRPKPSLAPLDLEHSLESLSSSTL